MRIIRDFQCSNDHITEKFLENTVESIECPECGEPSNKLISPVRSHLDVVTGDFPGATAKWARGREKQIQRERKAVANHGDDAAWDVAKNR
tara:strand:- start:2533 stop:2805 length:273 start_codon:yes stop_codon:yes gene_type:complete